MTKDEVMDAALKALDGVGMQPLDGNLGLCEPCEAALRAEAIAGTGREVALCPDCAGLVWAAVGGQRGPVYPFSVAFKDGSLHVTAPRYTDTIEATVGFADATPLNARRWPEAWDEAIAGVGDPTMTEREPVPVVVDGVLAGFAVPIRPGEVPAVTVTPDAGLSAGRQGGTFIDEAEGFDPAAYTMIAPRMAPGQKVIGDGAVRYFAGYTQVTEEQIAAEMAAIEPLDLWNFDRTPQTGESFARVSLQELQAIAEARAKPRQGTLTAEDAAKLEDAVVEQLASERGGASTWKTGPDAPPIQLRELPGSSVLFGMSAKVLDPDTGRDREVRLVVDAGRGLRFELGSARGGAEASADVSPYADRLRDALEKLIGGGR